MAKHDKIERLGDIGIASAPLVNAFKIKCAERGHDPAEILRDFILGVAVGEIKLPEKVDRYDIRWD